MVEGAMGVRVLIAYGAGYRSYREALAAALRGLRPAARVETSGQEGLREAVGRFDPHVVVSDRPNAVDPGGRAAWYELAPDPGDVSEACVGGERWASPNPGLAGLLGAVDETGRLLRAGRRPLGC